jgi:nucleoside 2-deoxyribosyltransferase
VKPKAYFAYPFSEYGSRRVDRLKAELSKRYELFDPYEVNGIGKSADIAVEDLKLIDECEYFIAYLPKTAIYPIQTSIELGIAFMKGKRIKLITSHDGPFLRMIRNAQAKRAKRG